MKNFIDDVTNVKGVLIIIEANNNPVTDFGGQVNNVEEIENGFRLEGDNWSLNCVGICKYDEEEGYIFNNNGVTIYVSSVDCSRQIVV